MRRLFFYVAGPACLVVAALFDAQAARPGSVDSLRVAGGNLVPPVELLSAVSLSTSGGTGESALPAASEVVLPVDVSPTGAGTALTALMAALLGGLGVALHTRRRGIVCAWVGSEPGGFPVVDAYDPAVYEDIVLRAK